MRAPAARGLWLSLLSGVALGLTFTPFGGPLLPFVAFAPVAYLLSRTAAPGVGLRAGFVTSVVAHAIGLQWMAPALSWRSPLAVPTVLTVLALIGICAAAAMESVPRLRRRFRCPLPLALGLAWVAFEWAAARVPGVAYAWLNTGASLVWYPELSWLAGVGGSAALTLWTVVVGGWIGLAAFRRVGRGHGSAEGTSVAGPTGPRVPPPVEGLAFALVILVPVAMGVLAGGSPVPGKEPIEVLAVQPGRGPSTGGLVAWEDPLRQGLEEDAADLVVFPERFLGGVAGPGPDAAALAARLGVPVLFGAMDLDVDARGDTTWFNAAFLVEPGEGTRSQVARKRHLVPGLEDGGTAWATALRLPGRGYEPGSRVSVLEAGGLSVGVLICYDSAFSGYARALAARGAELLIVVSNDDWLDPAAPPRSTIAYWQHETQGRLRARENGVPLVQVASTGRTFSVDAAGRTLPLRSTGAATVPLFASEVVRLPVGRPAPPTPFRRSGDVLGLFAFGVWLLGAWPGRGRSAGVPNHG